MPTNLQLPSQLSDLREHYLLAYRKFLADNTPRIGDLSPETLIFLPGPEDVPEPHRLFRPDAVWRGTDGQPQIARIDAPSPPIVPPTTLDAGGTPVSLYPFAWDDCPVSFSHPDFPWPDLHNWLYLHIDRHAQFPADPSGLHGVIHSVSPPESRGSRHYLYVDLGSAPVSALADLIDLLTSRGATRIAFGNPAGH